MQIPVTTPDGSKSHADIARIPDVCPSCGKSCVALLRYALQDWDDQTLQVVYQCPSETCKTLFIAGYSIPPYDPAPGGMTCTLVSSQVVRHVAQRVFSDHVAEISPDFCAIYAEAETAEVNRLRLVCGVGYRKALEFLIKDFVTKHIFRSDPASQEKARRASWVNA